MYVGCEIVDEGFVLYVGLLEALDCKCGGVMTDCVYVACM